jgi:hypothetical protein
VDDVVAEFGRRLNAPVAKSLPVDADLIVLLGYYTASQTDILRNLFRLRADGTVAWTISQRDAMGIVTDADWRDGKLVAWTWGGYMLVIDEHTGKVLDSVFTK